MPDRAHDLVQERIAELNEAVTSKTHFESEINELTSRVHSCQQRLQQLTRGTGYQESDAQDKVELCQVRHHFKELGKKSYWYVSHVPNVHTV